MIKRCEDCKFSDDCTKKDTIISNKQFCRHTSAVMCSRCDIASTCPLFEKIVNNAQCPKVVKKIKDNVKVRDVTNVERLKKIIDKYENSYYGHYKTINLKYDEDKNLILRFKCTVCGHEFDMPYRGLKLNGSVFSCPNMYCKSRRYHNYSEERTQIVAEDFSYRYEVINTYVKDDIQYYVFKCKVCGEIIEKPFYELKTGGGARFGCPNPSCQSRFHSSPEIRFSEEFDKLGIQYEPNTRHVLKGNKELDFYIPSKNLAIEYDGARWHNNVDNYYKYEECKSKGIRLIQVTEYEYYNKYDLLLSIIRSQLGIYDIKIGARKCEVKEITSIDSTRFLNENHIQGNIPSNVKLGLYYKDELVQVMTFGKPRYNNDYEWELLRESSKSGYLIYGGKSKLLNYFIKTYHPKSILSYCSKSKFSGISYEKCGFKLIGDTGPGYYYYKKGVQYHRTVFQKHKLAGLVGTLLDTYDENLTADENVLRNGYMKLYTYGNYVYGMTL